MPIPCSNAIFDNRVEGYISTSKHVRGQGGYFPRLKTFSSLQYPNFRRLFASTAFTSAGDFVQQITLGWYIYELTGSPVLVGALAACRGVPYVLVGPISGVFTDRLDRRRFLIGVQLFLTVLALAMAVLVASGYVRVWHLFAFALLNACGFAINSPLRQAMVSDLAPRSSLPNAVALIALATNFQRAIGPAIGGVLIAFFGPSTNFFIQGACFVGVTVMVFQIRIEDREKPAPGPFSPLSALREGLAYSLKDKRILALFLLAVIPSTFLVPFTMAIMPVFSKEVLGQGPGGLGLLLAGMGAGGMTGTFIMASLGNRNPVFSLGVGIAGGLALVLVSQVGSMGVAVPLLLAVGMFQQVFFATNNTILQFIIPDHMRGRVLGLYFMTASMSAVGSFTAGVLARSYDTRVAFLIGGLLVVGLFLVTAIAFRKAIRASKEAVSAPAGATPS